MDKDVPAGDGPLYDQALELKKSGRLYVQALKDGYRASAVAVSINEKVGRENGVLYKYYSGTWEKLPDLPAMKAQKKGRISRFELEEIPTAEANFALLMIGAVRIKKAGNYILYCGSNDGSQLFIDNQLLIDNDGYHGYIEKSGNIFLQTGIHLLEVRYFQMGGGRDLKVFWEGEDFGRNALTAEDLAVF